MLLGFKVMHAAAALGVCDQNPAAQLAWTFSLLFFSMLDRSLIDYVKSQSSAKHSHWRQSTGSCYSVCQCDVASIYKASGPNSMAGVHDRLHCAGLH